ncbi:RiPP maturation radical SAM C-methyltransferase [Myxococcaceae bacterium GXIMD 01537]
MSWRGALVSLPFISHRHPSIQLGLLKAIAGQRGFSLSTFHLNLDFAQQIGADFYERLCEHRRRLVGDWLFSVEAFGDDAPDVGEAFLERFREDLEQLLEGIPDPIERLRHVRANEVPRYLDRLETEIPWGDFRVVGFTSTFHQNAASFALARRLKRRFPGLVTVFGGANFDGDMGIELVRAVGAVDYAVSGEGDVAFCEFLAALDEGRDPAEVPGVISKSNGLVRRPAPRALFTEMDRLPVPDYDEFFERAEALGLLPRAGRRDVDLPFESARGCWWGQKHHCTFCGLNGNGMKFRAKSPERVLEDLSTLAQRYRSFRFSAVDNILDPKYLDRVLAPIAGERYDYEIFYEVKSNLTRPQLRALRDGGVRSIQPGIESLSSNVLRLMRKGVSGIQNVNLLRWAFYYGIEVAWNVLWGFPHETRADYEEQATLLRRIQHLQPPKAMGRIWMERFSPLYADRKSFPARDVRPEESYAFVYPRSVDLDQVAYFFDYQLENSLPDDAFDETQRVVRAWQEAWDRPARPRLTYFWSSDFLQIDDLREPGAAGTYTFQGALAHLYRGCSDAPTTAAALKQRLELPASVEEIGGALDAFCERGLMMRDGVQYLALALPAVSGR